VFAVSLTHGAQCQTDGLEEITTAHNNSGGA
jgi:hypothetical protein